MVEQNISVYSSYLGTLRNSLESQILSQCPDSRLNGHPEQRLPNTSSLSFKGPKANDILESFGSVAASAGAACHSDSITVSSVLEAMNVPIDGPPDLALVLLDIMGIDREQFFLTMAVMEDIGDEELELWVHNIRKVYDVAIPREGDDP